MIIGIGKARLEARRVFCIGRNYLAHVKELNNDLPSEPVVFAKPATSLVAPGQTIAFPSHGAMLHHEVEVVVAIGGPGRPATTTDARSMIAGVSVGVDLTLRDLQDDLRARGLPWEAGKSFDQSAPVGTFAPIGVNDDLADIGFELRVNGERRQAGTTANMIFDIPSLVVAVGRIWSLLAGDLIFTGTPEGVGALVRGDTFEASSPKIGVFAWHVV